MKLVDTDYCPNIQRTCIEEEYSPQNKITICHRFSTKQKCLAREERRRFCIDEYEYPNQKGGHPTWMVSWYDAQATCASVGKRLCYESEWVSACEGPDKLPFPYGHARDNTKCNIDNSWIQPSLPDVYSKDPQTRLIELSRLDQSAPSGALEGCVSGFGVRDLTGNFDEWVTVDQRVDDKSEWAGLKGGAWGHVRNACRPMTTSHPPDFTYYFIAFRCCREARGGSPSPPSFAGAPDVEPANRAPIQDPAYPPGPSRTKVGRERWPRPDATPKPVGSAQP
jgi:formylglycine-generating enzyme required for sulfatase activity